jgi:type I restriction enzyme R subunit
MIGRGTRKSPDLFGPGEDKKEFIIFDFCENFEFFEINPDGIEASQSEPISHRIFKTKLRIAEKLQESKYQENEPLQALRKQYLDELHRLISNLNRENYSVRRQLRYVDQYSHRERWDNLDKSDVATISKELAPLPVIYDNDNHARSFDLLLHNLQKAALEDAPDQNNYVKGIIFTANELAKKMNIPLIKAKKELVHQLMEGQYWDNIKIDHLEVVRSGLRGLIHLIKKKKKIEPVYSDFKDHIEGEAQEFDIIKIGTKLQSYKLRVERYLRDHSNMLAIQRVRKGERLTTAELETLEQIMFDGGALGTKEEFQKEYGTNKPLTYFIREILGFDKGAAKQAFSEFLDKGNLTADQITFINNIIDCLSQNGVVDKDRLFEPPFTDLHDDSALGLFPEEEATKIFSIVDRLNEGLG